MVHMVLIGHVARFSPVNVDNPSILVSTAEDATTSAEEAAAGSPVASGAAPKPDVCEPSCRLHY